MLGVEVVHHLEPVGVRVDSGRRARPGRSPSRRHGWRRAAAPGGRWSPSALLITEITGVIPLPPENATIGVLRGRQREHARRPGEGEHVALGDLVEHPVRHAAAGHALHRQRRARRRCAASSTSSSSAAGPRRRTGRGRCRTARPRTRRRPRRSAGTSSTNDLVSCVSSTIRLTAQRVEPVVATHCCIPPSSAPTTSFCDHAADRTRPGVCSSTIDANRGPSQHASASTQEVCPHHLADLVVQAFTTTTFEETRLHQVRRGARRHSIPQCVDALTGRGNRLDDRRTPRFRGRELEHRRPGPSPRRRRRRDPPCSPRRRRPPRGAPPCSPARRRPSPG